MGNYIADATELCTYFPQKRLEQLAADTSTQAATGLGDATVAANITAAIVSAESEIDGKLSTRFTVPLVAVPARVKLCAAHLAVFFLASRKPEVAEVYSKWYDRESKWLDGAAAAELGIVDSTGVAAPENSSILTTIDDAAGNGPGLVLGGGGLDRF